jgi:ubiquinone/menaquinone biosynthesis C-methylase UbiE
MSRPFGVALAQPEHLHYSGMTMDHQKTIHDQFTRQAVVFSSAPSMADPEAIRLLIEAGRATGTHRSLDVACGPGLVALAFASVVRSAVGLDTTQAMLDRARELQHQQKVANTEWVLGEAYALPFSDDSFDIVTCRFAFHHMLQPSATLAEMLRVARPGGRLVLCDAVASEHSEKALSFNAFERMRDPSTVRFLTASELRGLFRDALLPVEAERAYRVPTELEALLGTSFPAKEDLPKLRAAVETSLSDDGLGMNTRLRGGRIILDYMALILSAQKPV